MGRTTRQQNTANGWNPDWISLTEIRQDDVDARYGRALVGTMPEMNSLETMGLYQTLTGTGTSVADSHRDTQDRMGAADARWAGGIGRLPLISLIAA